MEILELTTPAELGACERVQCMVWGEPVPEVSVSLFRAAQYAGALVAGAVEDDALLGFVYGFPAVREGHIGQHSHLLAVLPEARGRGIGQALKWFQRDWCLARGVAHVTWTFDPLRAGNAKLNLEHLGASVGEYRPDFYGPLGGSLNGELPSDRLIATWVLEDAEVTALAGAIPRPEAAKPAYTRLISEDGEPRHCRMVEGEEDQPVWLELPSAISPETDFEHALRWRLALRDALMPLFEQGYRITRFVAGGYVMTR